MLETYSNEYTVPFSVLYESVRREFRILYNDIEVFEAVKTFWDNENVVESFENPRHPLKDKIIHNGKHYKVYLPFKENQPIIPDNYPVIIRFLKNSLNYEARIVGTI